MENGETQMKFVKQKFEWNINEQQFVESCDEREMAVDIC